MSADVMRVRLHLRGVRVTEVVVDAPAELVVGVVATKKLSECPGCGSSCRRVHDRRQRQIRDLEISGRRTVLLWTQRRFVCDECGKRHTETHPQFVGSITRRLARRLVQDAQVMSIQAVSRRHRISWHLIMGLVTDWSSLIGTRRRRRKCRVFLDNPAPGSLWDGYSLPDSEPDIGSVSPAGRREPPAGKGLELPLGLARDHDVLPSLYPVDRPGHISSISIGLHEPHDSRYHPHRMAIFY